MKRQHRFGGVILFAMFVAAAMQIPITGISVNASTSPSELSPTPSPQPPYPSNILNLTNWKLTLPIGTDTNPTDPAEIKQPELMSYTIDPWFTVTSDGKGVLFRAPVSGLTTSGSKYPRSELREMTDGGTSTAKWSSKQGTHTMVVDEEIIAVPKIKQHVVAGQIHGSSDDIIVLRLEYPNLYVNVNGKNVYTLDSHYTLGKRFTVKFVVNGGQTKVFYNGNSQPSYTLNKKYSGAYFKAGAYTQSNCSRELWFWLCNGNNYGEVAIYALTVTHQ